MKMVKAVMALVLSAIFLGAVAGVAAANVPGVAVNAPPPPPAPNVATAGSDALVKVVVTHRDTGSPALHYVDRVMLYDGNKLIKEWKYDQNSYRKDETWTESLTVPAKSDMQLRAVAHCTVHGYDLAGMHVRVLPSGTTPAQMMQTDAASAGMQAFGYANAGKASDFVSSADAKLLRDNIKANSGELKSFQAKMSDWMKSSEGKQFIASFGTAGAPMAAGEMGRQTPAAVMPTKVAMMKKNTGMPALRASPSARPTMKPGIKYLSITPRGVKTPAESYGIYGLGGNVPSAQKAMATVRSVPSGSSTAGVPASHVTIPYVAGDKSGRGTVGTSKAVALSDDKRYAGRGPGLVGTTIVQTPASAPGPNARPTAFVICRVC
ncbi:MAG TPA: hypothetical protein VMC84_01055 [Methanocella sp.]|uniref:hypothetical protein n=1 Tax=Methanocella sp. TaxID=2052833 RepID=UPI002C2E5938|nr:hypothetical protein [Methanocella sp.]HTY89743.1 hypothetical protein [Methanocella sp.]